MPSKCDVNFTENKPALLYEYAVFRYVPCVERGEFVNIGLIMMCKRKDWLQVEFCINEERIKHFCPEANVDVLRQQIDGIIKIARRDASSGGPIARLDVPERFRWLAAERSASLRCSPTHAGKTFDLKDTFDRLLREVVL